MRQDWIEFEDEGGTKLSLRPEYIQAFKELNDGAKIKNLIAITYDTQFDGDSTIYYVKGTYEQVKQKIMEAEKVDLRDVVVERFTRDEYESLEACVGYYAEYGEIDNDTQIELAKLQNKLNEILKEDE